MLAFVFALWLDSASATNYTRGIHMDRTAQHTEYNRVAPTVGVRFNPEAKRLLERDAKAAGVSVATFLRELGYRHLEKHHGRTFDVTSPSS